MIAFIIRHTGAFAVVGTIAAVITALRLFHLHGVRQATRELDALGLPPVDDPHWKKVMKGNSVSYHHGPVVVSTEGVTVDGIRLKISSEAQELLDPLAWKIRDAIETRDHEHAMTDMRTYLSSLDGSPPYRPNGKTGGQA